MPKFSNRSSRSSSRSSSRPKYTPPPRPRSPTPSPRRSPARTAPPPKKVEPKKKKSVSTPAPPQSSNDSFMSSMTGAFTGNMIFHTLFGGSKPHHSNHTPTPAPTPAPTPELLIVEEFQKVGNCNEIFKNMNECVVQRGDFDMNNCKDAIEAYVNCMKTHKEMSVEIPTFEN